jgi:hypothetical protein
MERIDLKRLHEEMYEQSLLFLALRSYPDSGVRLAAARQHIIDLYSRIQNLA